MEPLQLTVEDQVKRMIVAKLGLDISPDEIGDEVPIFDLNEDGDGLDLDSVDALELVVGIHETFGYKPQSADLPTMRNVKSIADMIRARTGGR